ncbi:MAG: MarR family transcriptional regulator [bacterium]|nr:MarR family transcriptional regulator [bacterium]
MATTRSKTSATTRAKNDALRRGSAKDAIQQAAPFRSSGQEALVNLLLTTDALRWRTSEMLGQRVEGLTMPQYNVLRILRGAGASGLPTLEIAERMMERTPGITRMLDRLEAKGWVERARSEADRRQVFCRLTRDGAKVVRSLDRPVDALDESMFAALSARERRDLIRLLDKLRNGLTESH